ncbi:MAG: hypothetical protein V1779_14240 [bacterium]
MKREYDFSKGERGKFFNKNAELLIPIYLDSDIQDYINKLSIKKKKNPQDLVNNILKKNISLIKSIQ